MVARRSLCNHWNLHNAWVNLNSISFYIVMSLQPSKICITGHGDGLLDKPVSLVDRVKYGAQSVTWNRNRISACLEPVVMTLTLYICSAGYGECLLDKPVSLGYNRKMFRDYVTPGEAFDSSRQCSLVFGSGSHICPYMVSNSVICNVNFGLVRSYFHG